MVDDNATAPLKRIERCLIDAIAIADRCNEHMLAAKLDDALACMRDIVGRR